MTPKRSPITSNNLLELPPSMTQDKTEPVHKILKNLLVGTYMTALLAQNSSHEYVLAVKRTEFPLLNAPMALALTSEPM